MGSICNRVDIEKNGSIHRISVPIKKLNLELELMKFVFRMIAIGGSEFKKTYSCATEAHQILRELSRF